MFESGAVMKVGQEIESIRKKLGFSVVFMCNVFNVSEPDYYKIIAGKYRLNTYQLIMFIDATKTPLKSIEEYL